MFFKKPQSGQLLVEILIAISLAAVLLPTLIGSVIISVQGKAQEQNRTQAVLLQKEAEDAVRNIRDSGWTNLPANGTYHPVVSGGAWSLSPNSESINGFTRQVVLASTSRDSDGNIVTSGGTVDPSTRTVIVTVSWSSPIAASITSTMYLTRFDNMSYTETTQADFDGSGSNLSIQSGTTVVNNEGGEVVLGQGNANWCRPQDSILSTYTLPRVGNAIASSPGAAVGDASSAYVGMGDGTNGMTYQTLSISDPPTPTGAPVVTGVGAGYSSSYKTNAVANDGTYTYLATDGSTNQVVILDSSYNVKSTITLPSGTNANGISVNAGVAYVTSSDKVYSYDVTNPAAPILRGSATLWDSNATAMQAQYVAGKLYVSMANSLTGLEIFTVSNGGRSFSYWSIASVQWFLTPVGLSINSTGTRAYIAFTASGSIKGGFYIIDTDPKDRKWFFIYYSPSIATYNTNWDGNGTMNPLSMTIATANKAIIVGTGGSQQYQVVDITNDNPTHCGGLSISQGVSAVSSVIQPDGRVYAYAISGEANNQFKVIEGGSGGNYTTSGTFTSDVFDAGYSSAFNRFIANINQPSQATISAQVGVAAPVGGNCQAATFDFVGPDGSTSDYYYANGATISGLIPFEDSGNYANPQQCFRYKFYLGTSDTSQTPTLYDMTVNYSP